MAALNKQRNQELAGKTVKQGSYSVTYDDRGYVRRATKDGGKSATSTAKTTKANNSAAHQEAYQAAQRGDWDAVGTAINKIGMTTSDGHGGYDMSEANAYLKELSDEFKYNAKDYIDQKAKAAAGTGGTSSGTGRTGADGGSTGYTEYIEADQGLSTQQLAKIQSYRELAKSGQITWTEANQLANAIRQAAGGYTVDTTGKATYAQPAAELPEQQPYGSFEEFVGDMGYDEYADQTKAYIRAAVQQAIDNYNQQIESTNKDSEELARQAYVAKMMGQRNLDQQLAANGYAGGMADSQRIAVETNYENQLNDLELQRLETIDALESAIAQAQLSGNLQAAQELSAYLQQLQNQWVSYVQNQQQLNNQNYWNQKQLDAQNAESAYTKALNLINQGFMPDDATLTAAGISKLEAQNRLGLNAGTGSDSAVVSSGGTVGRSAGTNASGSADQNQAAPQSGGSGQGMTYSNLLNRLNLAMSEEKPEAAEKIVSGLIDTYWDAMSSTQQEEVNALLRRYGFA